MLNNRQIIVEKLKGMLDPARFEHSLRVEKVALALGRHYRVNPGLLSLAALLHDCARRYSRRQLMRKARAMKLKIDPIRQFEPKLFHAEISAHLAKTEFGVKSAAVLSAIRHHTTGAPGMSALDKIIYLSDHVEEGRDFPGIKKLRTLAFKNLDRAVFESTSSMVRFLLERNLPIYPKTIETRNSFLKIS